MVTKTLSIRVGDHDDAGVCFDTANLNLRAGWTGGFLKFDAARFGLLNIPKINGEVDFIAPEGPGWIDATGRFSGFHVHGKRIVLEYKIGDTTVWESPWVTKTNGVSVFIRTLEIGPGHESLALRLIERTNATVVSYGNSPALVNGLIAVDERSFISMSAIGGDATLARIDNKILLNVPPRNQSQHISVIDWIGTT